MTIHSFAASLARSEQEADNPIWGRVYERAFPSMRTSMSVRTDGWAQRGAIDRVIVLASGKTLYVDEKIREKDYGDILLKYWSNVERRVPGWVAKDLACDFIAYAVLPTEICYLLPFQQLRAAWKQNRAKWVGQYKPINANNGTYTTRSVGVPVKVIFSALQRAMVVSWGDQGA